MGFGAARPLFVETTAFVLILETDIDLLRRPAMGPVLLSWKLLLEEALRYRVGGSMVEVVEVSDSSKLFPRRARLFLGAS